MPRVKLRGPTRAALKSERAEKKRALRHAESRHRSLTPRGGSILPTAWEATCSQELGGGSPRDARDLPKPRRK